MQTPVISLYIGIGNQQYGPFNYDMCKQMATTGQLTPQTMVWMQGMPGWAPASTVPELQTLFVPPAAPQMPPMPPMGGTMPPPIM